jgi:hypothetical protein
VLENVCGPCSSVWCIFFVEMVVQLQVVMIGDFEELAFCQVVLLDFVHGLNWALGICVYSNYSVFGQCL